MQTYYSTTPPIYHPQKWGGGMEKWATMCWCFWQRCTNKVHVHWAGEEKQSQMLDGEGLMALTIFQRMHGHRTTKQTLIFLSMSNLKFILKDEEKNLEQQLETYQAYSSSWHAGLYWCARRRCCRHPVPPGSRSGEALSCSPDVQMARTPRNGQFISIVVIVSTTQIHQGLL